MLRIFGIYLIGDDMKKLNFSFIFVLVFLIFFFTFPREISSGVSEGFNVCKNVIVPSLFPFLIISSFVVKSGLSDYENKITRFISQKIFRLPTEALPVILMSFIGGFPVGIKMASELYSQGKINSKAAERLSLFCVNAGPAYVINAVGMMMMKNKKAGVLIFISLTLASFLTAIFSGFFYKETVNPNIKKSLRKNFSDSLVESVSESVSAMISICAWILFISAFLPLTDKISWEFFRDFLKAFSEVTSGSIIFTKKYPAHFLAGVIGFNGLCVHCQLLPMLNKMKVKLSVFFTGRVLSAVLSMLIAKLLFEFFPCDVQTFSTLSNSVSGGLSVSIPALCSLFFMCGLLILDLSLDRCKKIC